MEKSRKSFKSLPSSIATVSGRICFVIDGYIDTEDNSYVGVVVRSKMPDGGLYWSYLEPDYTVLRSDLTKTTQYWGRLKEKCEYEGDFRASLEEYFHGSGFSGELNNYVFDEIIKFIRCVQYYEDKVEIQYTIDEWGVEPAFTIHQGDIVHSKMFKFADAEYEMSISMDNELRQLLTTFKNKLTNIQNKTNINIFNSRAWKNFIGELGC